MNEPWPVTDLDPVRRLHALAGGIRGAHVTEAYIDAPFERVWSLLGDLEGAFGQVVPDMERLRVVRRQGKHVEALARSRYGMRARLRGCSSPAGAGCRADSSCSAWRRRRKAQELGWRSPAECACRPTPL